MEDLMRYTFILSLCGVTDKINQRHNDCNLLHKTGNLTSDIGADVCVLFLD